MLRMAAVQERMKALTRSLERRVQAEEHGFEFEQRLGQMGYRRL